MKHQKNKIMESLSIYLCFCELKIILCSRVRGNINVNKIIFRWSEVLASWLARQKTRRHTTLWVQYGQRCTYINSVTANCQTPTTDNSCHDFVEEKIDSNNRDEHKTYQNYIRSTKNHPRKQALWKKQEDMQKIHP